MPRSGKQWLALQGRPARFFVIPTLVMAPVVAAIALILWYDRTHPDGVEWVEPGATTATSGDMVMGFVVVALVVAVIGGTVAPRIPAVRIDDDGFTVYGLPWRRVEWRDVEFVRRYRGVRLNYVLITTTVGDVWLTRANTFDFLRTPDLDEELATIEWRWRDWKRRQEGEKLPTKRRQ